MISLKDYDSEFDNKWCPGCGNFSILSAMKDAFVGMEIPPEKLLIVSGIGQAGKTPHFLKCNMFHGLHGRALPVATGAKLANHDLTILVNSGDGDCYAEGGNHFLNAVRRNIDITLLVHNNRVYGLTKGQASPTSDVGMTTKIQPQGVLAEPFNALAVALSLGAGFVARGFSGNEKQLAQLITEAMLYKGFSFIDILQPCVSFNRINTYGWYKERVYNLEEKGYVPDNREKAMKLCMGTETKIPVGILFKQKKPSYTEKLELLKDGPLTSKKYDSEKLNAYLKAL